MLCCSVLLLPFVLLVYASTEVSKNVVLLPESAPESYEQKLKYVFGQKSVQVQALSCLRCVGNNMSKKHIYHILPTKYTY